MNIKNKISVTKKSKVFKFLKNKYARAGSMAAIFALLGGGFYLYRSSALCAVGCTSNLQIVAIKDNWSVIYACKADSYSAQIKFYNSKYATETALAISNNTTLKKLYPSGTYSGRFADGYVMKIKHTGGTTISYTINASKLKAC